MTRTPARRPRDPREAQSEDEHRIARWVERHQAGDNSAFELIYRRFHGCVIGEALRVLDDRAEAQDVVQEVFVTALRVLPTFQNLPGGLDSWLRNTARYTALNSLRRASRARTTAPEILEQLAEATGVPATTATGPDADIWGLVGTLPELPRRVLQMRFLEGLSMCEIAERLDRSPGAVDQAQRRGLRALRTRLEQLARR